LVIRDGLPAVGPEGAVPEHLEVLALLPALPVGREAVRHADAVDRHLRDAPDPLWRGDIEDVQDGREDVGDVVELVADPAAIGDPGGPGDDQRIPYPGGLSVR